MDPEKALFVLGYAGWGPGQIEGELKSNGWIHCDPDKTTRTDLAHDAKWRAALAKLGVDIQAFPPTPPAPDGGTLIAVPIVVPRDIIQRVGERQRRE